MLATLAAPVAPPLGKNRDSSKQRTITTIGVESAQSDKAWSDGGTFPVLRVVLANPEVLVLRFVPNRWFLSRMPILPTVRVSPKSRTVRACIVPRDAHDRWSSELDASFMGKTD